MRIAVGGFQHETNTFAAHPAALADFEAPDAWPGLVRGPELFDAVHGINLPAAGFISAARFAHHDLVPLTWCSATPSGRVTEAAYEHIASLLLTDLAAHRDIDAVYLDLHGAMVADHIDDADGEFLRRVRHLVGPSVRVIASLDYHANVSELMVRSADALIAYRSYPHVDMSETGERAMRCLSDMADRPLASAHRALPFLIPLTSQCTLADPMATLLTHTAALDRAPILALNFTPGFPAADVAECGPSIFGVSTDPEPLDAALEHLAQRVNECEPDFALQIYSIDAALREVTRLRRPGHRIILADTQDNPGGGGTADTTSLLKALHENHVPRVLAGILWDPIAAARAHAAGVGAIIDLAIGGRSGLNETPFVARFEVLALGDGKFGATGPFYLGSRMNLGPMALVRTGELTVAIASRKQQAADQAMFRHLRVEPADFSVLVLKSSVHFRADFGAIANHILVVDAPGANIADPSRLRFAKAHRRVASRELMRRS